MNPILIIHAIGNKERYSNILHQFRTQPFSYEIVPAIMTKTSRYGIAKSHKKCIQLAKDRDWSYAIICEDDVDLLSKHSLQIFHNLIPTLPLDCDVFLGGIHSGEIETPDTKVGYSKVVGNWSSLHLYWVPQRFYDRFLEADESMNIDYVLSNLPGINVYVAYPLLVAEISGYSFNAGKMMEYSKNICQKYKCIK